MSKLDTALNEYVKAATEFRDVAIQEIIAAVKERYPTAAQARVTGVVSEDYSEHDIVVRDAAGKQLNHVLHDDGSSDDWPWESDDEDFDEDWFVTVTEGACVFDDHATIPIP